MFILLTVSRTQIWIQWLQSPSPIATTATRVNSVEICSLFKALKYPLNPKSRLTTRFPFSFLHFFWPGHHPRSWTPSFLGRPKIWDQLSSAIWADSSTGWRDELQGNNQTLACDQARKISVFKMQFSLNVSLTSLHCGGWLKFSPSVKNHPGFDLALWPISCTVGMGAPLMCWLVPESGFQASKAKELSCSLRKTLRLLSAALDQLNLKPIRPQISWPASKYLDIYRHKVLREIRDGFREEVTFEAFSNYIWTVLISIPSPKKYLPNPYYVLGI